MNFTHSIPESRERRARTLAVRIVSPRGILRVVLFLLLGAFSGYTAVAQDTSATILGNVTDPSGAAVSKATVVVTNTATNVAVTVQTTDSGAYNVPQLIPGTYRSRPVTTAVPTPHSLSVA